MCIRDRDGLGAQGRSPAEAHEHAGRARAHEVQCRGVARGTAHDHGDVEVVDELLEVQRILRLGHVLRGDRGACLLYTSRCV